MSIHDLEIPVAFVLYVFEEADSKSMKRVEDRVIIICAIEARTIIVAPADESAEWPRADLGDRRGNR